jgi:hypothetical protein
LSIYHILFLITLAPAVVLGLRRGGDFAFAGLMLAASFAAAWAGFSYASPVWNNAVSDFLFGFLMTLFCRERRVLVVAAFFYAATGISIVYGICAQPEVGYSIYYAHLLSIIGHIENLALIFGASDVGFRDGLDGRGRSLVWARLSPGYRRRPAVAQMADAAGQGEISQP